MLVSTAPVVIRKRRGKRPAWDLKGQLCDLKEEFKSCLEKTQTLELDNQGLRQQLREAQEQVTTLRTELAGVRSQADQDQQRLSAHVLELEECLGTRERLIRELHREKLQLEEQLEVRPASQVTLPSRGHTSPQATLKPQKT